MNTTATPFTTTTALATDAQRKFALSLIGARQLTDIEFEVISTLIADADLTKVQASDIITTLKARPFARRAATVTVDPGMYLLDGTPVRVQKSRESDRVYAKALVDGTFEYQTGLIHKLTADMRMTPDQAAEYGRRTGQCCVCSRTLTAEESVMSGIGPVCSGRL